MSTDSDKEMDIQGARNCLGSPEGRTFMAYILKEMKFPDIIAWSTFQELYGIDNVGAIKMLEEHFLKGQTK